MTDRQKCDRCGQPARGVSELRPTCLDCLMEKAEGKTFEERIEWRLRVVTEWRRKHGREGGDI